MTALFEVLALEDGKCTPFDGKWRVFCDLGRHLFAMVCHSNSGVKFAPLYVYSFPFLRPHFLADAEKVNIGNDSPEKFDTVADKLRYYRHKKGLLQREVADYVGVERTTYSAYEECKREYYPLDVLERIANHFEVDVVGLLDGYHTFLRNGQARQVKALRVQMNLTQADFATRFAVTKDQIKGWEQGRVRMAKKFWEIIFEE
ncbi:MAG: helix-turn-helix domain-containing protein [Defluviitaleaceae bacterium]|nr:helix-turn-helix domain-containing protein [Defluviitaleaceae bacterium]